MNKYHFEPYPNWSTRPVADPSHLNFIIGVDGVIYPPTFLKSLKSYGSAFKESCPTADDIWLTRIAYREGFKVVSLSEMRDDFPLIPGSQNLRLYDHNVGSGANQIQLAQTFTKEDRAELYALQQRA